jgi:hypothetical protein
MLCMGESIFCIFHEIAQPLKLNNILLSPLLGSGRSGPIGRTIHGGGADSSHVRKITGPDFPLYIDEGLRPIKLPHNRSNQIYLTLLPYALGVDLVALV